MMQLRSALKRRIPRTILDKYQELRHRMGPPPFEDIYLHSYSLVRESNLKPRLSLVIPTVAPNKVFGGVATALDFFLEAGKRSGADLRLVLDDLSSTPDTSIVDKLLRAHGLGPQHLSVVPRTEEHPTIEVRPNDVFLTYNWWTTLNIRSLIDQQASAFSAAPKPYLYLIQDYEPQFYEFSSSHMMVRLAFDMRTPYWGVFNSTELYNYCIAQGHRPERSFVFEPKISESLRPFLPSTPPKKKKRVLVYGRPGVARNCFPAIVKGLKAWVESDPDQASWDIVSAGTRHTPIPIGKGRVLRSVGKLSLEDYAQLLQSSAVGISLMSSPHPSYPPLEMAHFGVLTLTNTYANKDLGLAHDNITSLPDIIDQTIAEFLSKACVRFTENPERGFSAGNHIPWFLRQNPYECLDDIVTLLNEEVWKH